MPKQSNHLGLDVSVRFYKRQLIECVRQCRQRARISVIATRKDPHPQHIAGLRNMACPYRVSVWLIPPTTIRYGIHFIPSDANPCNMSVSVPWLSIVLHLPTFRPALALSPASSLVSTRRSLPFSSPSFNASLNATTHQYQEALLLVFVAAFIIVYRLLRTIVASQYSKTMEQESCISKCTPAKS